MPTVTVSGEAGSITVTVDDGQPVPVKSAEEACAIVEQTFGQPDADEGMANEQMMQGIQSVRGGSLG